MQANIETSKGTIKLKLFYEEAPITVANFVNLSINNKHTHFPTSTMAKINFEVFEWNLIEFGFGKLDWLIRPKELN